MTTGHHTDDDFSHFEREIARQRGHNPDSLHKRAKLTGTAHPTVTSTAKFGPRTQAAIDGTTAGVGITAM